MQKIFDEMYEKQEKYKKSKLKNECNKSKDIADRVMVWGGTWSKNLETGETYSFGHKIFDSQGILIEKDSHIEYAKNGMLNYGTVIMSNNVILDSVVYFPKYNIKVAVQMKEVKLIK